MKGKDNLKNKGIAISWVTERRRNDFVLVTHATKGRDIIPQEKIEFCFVFLILPPFLTFLSQVCIYPEDAFLVWEYIPEPLRNWFVSHYSKGLACWWKLDSQTNSWLSIKIPSLRVLFVWELLEGRFGSTNQLMAAAAFHCGRGLEEVHEIQRKAH